MLYDLAEAFEQLDKDDSVRAIVLKGGDSFFAAGTDIQSTINTCRNSTWAKKATMSLKMTNMPLSERVIRNSGAKSITI